MLCDLGRRRRRRRLRRRRRRRLLLIHVEIHSAPLPQQKEKRTPQNNLLIFANALQLTS